MRTRNRRIVNDHRPAVAFSGFYQTQGCGQPWSAPIIYNGGAAATDVDFEEEYMRDDVGVGKPHAVYHRWKHVQSNTASPLLVAPSAGGAPGKVGYSAHVSPVWVPSHASWLQDVSNWNVSDTSGSVPPRWTIITGGLNETVMRNDVVERARQLKADVLLNIVEANQLWPSVRSLVTCLPKMQSKWKTLRSQIRTASGAYLAWKFGVSPVLSDSISIIKHMARLKDDLKRHTEGKILRFSKNAALKCSFDDTTVIEGTYNGVNWGQRYYFGGIVSAPNVRYVLVVKPKIQYGTEFFQKLDYAMSRFSTSPASFAWEKVPFSFVVDWFVDIRGALEKLDKAMGFSPFDIVSFTRSHSYGFRSSMTHVFRETCGGAVLHDLPCGSVEYKHYERSLVSGTGSPVSWKPRFGKNQAGITAALISQMLSKL